MMPTLLILAVMVGAYLSLARDITPPPQVYPAAALAYAREHGLTAGNVYNDYNFGGFLIGNGVPTFIDGRGVPFGDMLDDYFYPSDQRFQAALDRYGVTWALVRPDTVQAVFFDKMEWHKEYGDKEAIVYAKRCLSFSMKPCAG